MSPPAPPPPAPHQELSPQAPEPPPATTSTSTVATPDGTLNVPEPVDVYDAITGAFCSIEYARVVAFVPSVTDRVKFTVVSEPTADVEPVIAPVPEFIESPEGNE